MTVSKIGLSCNDDKLWIHNKNIKTRNFGHWRTDVEKNLETFLIIDTIWLINKSTFGRERDIFINYFINLHHNKCRNLHI